MTDTRALWALLLFGIIGALLYLLAPVLTPFLLSALLAYMFNPLVTRLEGWRVPRLPGVLLLFVLAGGVLVLLFAVLLPMLQQQISLFAENFPNYLERAQQALLPWLRSVFGEQLAFPDVATLRQRLLGHWQEIGQAAGDVLATLTRSGMRVAGWLMNLVLVPVVTFYLLRDWNRLVARVPLLFPAALRPKLVRLAREADEVLGAFLRGQLLVMAALAALYATGLWLIGLDLALPIGLLAGLVSFVPYLGFIVGLVAAGIAVLFQFQDAWMLLWVLAVFSAAQMLDGMLLTPSLVGDRIGLHPVVVILAVLAGGQLFGFFGVLLALPVAAVALVWLRHLHTGVLRNVAPSPARRRRSRS